MHTTIAARALAAVGTIVLTALALVAPAAADGDAPAGNNGTIKIDDVAMDDGNENVPHPGCTFVVDFFGYDVGTRTATLAFVGQPPTGGGDLLVDAFTFEVASRDSGNQLNVSRTVDLSSSLAGIEPHPQQGWHVKLTVHVDGAQGADTKHKVFWVSECAAAPDEVAEVEAPTAEVLAAEQEAVAAWMAAEQANAAQAEAAQVAGEQLAAAAPAPAGTQLPRTGSHAGELVGTAVMVVATGALLCRMARAQLA